MILTLTPNPAIDVTIIADALERGGSQVIDAARRRAGGKGVNVSRVLVQQSVATHAVLPVGVDDQAWFHEDLAAVPHTLVPCHRPTRHSYALVESTADTTTVLNESGQPRGETEWGSVLATLRERAADARVTVCSGSLPPGAPSDLLTQVVAVGRDAGVPVVLDIAGSRLVTAAEAGADVLKPNRDELTAAFGDIDPLDGARALQGRGAGLVVVSLGAEGMLLIPPDGEPLHARLRQPLRGNPTGAGDAAVAALASVLAGSDPTTRRPLNPRALPRPALQALARRAVAWSAAAVTSPVAGELGTPPEALERLVVMRDRAATRAAAATRSAPSAP